MGSKIHQSKIKLIHVARRQLGLSQEDYRSVLMRATGKDSASELDETGFELAMIEFNRLGFRSARSRRNYGERPGFASPAQVELIRRLWTAWRGDSDPGDTALNQWLTKYHHVSALRFVDQKAVVGIIHALKSMRARKTSQSDHG